MAIGSAPEIGLAYKNGIDGWLGPDGDSHKWRAEVGDDLLGGYATLCYVNRERVASIQREWEDTDG